MDPIAEGLFIENPDPRLIGGRRKDTGRVVFPRPSGADEDLYEPILLSPRGRIWSYTVQQFRPKSPPYDGPDVFEPFILAYVELENEVIIETRIVGARIEDITIGAPVRLLLFPFESKRAGGPVKMFGFELMGEAA
ncbi:MAG: OB-fold domain-containing protein [Caulobacterales bacterium]